MAIKLIASDLDKTLLMNELGELSDYTKETIEKMLGQGVCFVPCSARIYSGIPEYFKKNKRIKYIVCSNGATVVNQEHDEESVNNLLTAEKAREVLDIANSVNPYWTIAVDGKFYSNRKIIEDRDLLGIDEEFFNFLSSSRNWITDYNEVLLDGKMASKIHFITRWEKIKSELKESISNVEDIFITSSDITNVEISNPHASKGKGLKWVMDTMQFSADECMAFGDNENDITMFEVVKHSCAVENATSELKKVAEYIVGHHAEDGVAKHINKILNLE